MPAERSKALKRSDSTGVITSAVPYFQNHIDTSAPTGNQFVWASQPEPTTTFMDISFADNMSYSSFSDDMPPLVCAPPQTEFVMFPPPNEAGSPRKQPHSKKKPENHIPRPPNAFILFRSSFIKSQHVSTAIETNHSTLSKIIGLTWQNLPEEERQVWHLKAKQALDEHKRKFPKYAFRPMQTKSKGAASEKRKVREVEPKDMKRCTKIAQLLVEGKKGDELDAAIHEFDKHHVPEIVTRFEAPITERAFRRSSSAPIPDTERSKKGQSFLQHVASSPRKPRSSSTRPSRCSTPADGLQHSFSFNEHVHSPTPMFKEEQSLFTFDDFSFNNTATPIPNYEVDPLSVQETDPFSANFNNPLTIDTSFMDDWVSSPLTLSPVTPDFMPSPTPMSLPPSPSYNGFFETAYENQKSAGSFDVLSGQYPLYDNDNALPSQAAQTCGPASSDNSMGFGMSFGNSDSMYAPDAFSAHHALHHQNNASVSVVPLSHLDFSAFMNSLPQYAM